MIKLKNKVTGNIVEVSVEHANMVLLPQGKYEEFKEEPKVEVKVAPKVSKKKTSKKVK